LKLGIVSDLHCNIEGLNRALEILGAIDALLCLGDSIYEYRFSNEVVAALKDMNAHTILGNHEEVFLGPLGGRARERAGNGTGSNWNLAAKNYCWFIQHRGNRAEPMFSNTVPCWKNSAKRTPISCFSATPINSWFGGSARFWSSIPDRRVTPATPAMVAC